MEMEAYAHQGEMDYLQHPPHGAAQEWKVLARMNVDEKIRFLEKNGIKSL